MSNDVVQARRHLAPLAFACVFPSLMTWVYFVVLAGRREAGVAYAVGKVLQFSFPFVWVRFVERRPIRLSPPRRTEPTALLFGVVVMAVILAGYFGGLRGSELVAGARGRMLAKLTPIGLGTPLGFVAMAGFYSVAHSFLEEYYWRWYVFGRLRERVRPALATVISSLGFASHHVILLSSYAGGSWLVVGLLSVGVAVGGAVWAWLYHRRGSLYGPWWSHGLVDVALMVVGYDLLFGI